MVTAGLCPRKLGSSNALSWPEAWPLRLIPWAFLYSCEHWTNSLSCLSPVKCSCCNQRAMPRHVALEESHGAKWSQRNALEGPFFSSRQVTASSTPTCLIGAEIFPKAVTEILKLTEYWSRYQEPKLLGMWCHAGTRAQLLWVCP